MFTFLRTDHCLYSKNKELYLCVLLKSQSKAESAYGSFISFLIKWINVIFKVIYPILGFSIITRENEHQVSSVCVQF